MRQSSSPFTRRAWSSMLLFSCIHGTCSSMGACPNTGSHGSSACLLKQPRPSSAYSWAASWSAFPSSSFVLRMEVSFPGDQRAVGGGRGQRVPTQTGCRATGGSFPFTVGRIEHGFNVRPDLCQTECKVQPREFLGKFWTDSLVHDPVALDLLINVIGEDNIMLGTDYPFPLGELQPGKLILEALDGKPELQEKLLSGNCLKFLGIDKSRFA
eukprot:m.32279 g.32279  ORF g.32279 m.32279 type:complete len:212 (+) comp5497_c0_seq2:479-1114(+)